MVFLCHKPNSNEFRAKVLGNARSWGTEEGALAEKNKTTLDILNDYRDYHDYDKVLSVWTEGT
jgi:hypothetical protein